MIQRPMPSPTFFLALVSLLAATLMFVGCGGDGGQSEGAAERAAGDSSRNSSGASESAADLGDPLSVDGLTFQAPAAWSRMETTSQMRRAQFSIPGKDTEDGEMVLYFFGVGSGGSAQANIDRWVGQFEIPSGTEGPGTGTFSANGLEFTTVEVQGTMLPSNMPGMGGGQPRPDWGMLGAVVEGPGGPWFFKATGPEAVMKSTAPDFEAMLRSARAGG